MKDIYTVKDIADMLEITAFGVRKYIYDGRLKAEKVGNTYFIKAADLVRFLKERGLLDPDTDI